MRRRAEFRPFSWINDLWIREQLDLSPPYQRRSVWPDRFRADFITTALLNYPCPAIFLYEEIRTDGSFLYKVVDGKQRLTALFDFVKDTFAVAEDYPSMSLRGKKFSELEDGEKLGIWRYAFAVEFIEQENETIINDIFNRINKNVARLTNQELRHALFSGIFISTAEVMANLCEEKLPANFPNIAPQSRRQMKDVENASTMLLFIEHGERSMSQADLDRAYRDREDEWEQRDEAVRTFRSAIDFIADVVSDNGSAIQTSRIRNQADFYSLFGAIVELKRERALPDYSKARERLQIWLARLRQVERQEIPQQEAVDDFSYLEAARSASNDAGPRRVRIDRVKEILRGI